MADDDDDDLDQGSSAQLKKPKSDAFVGMLVISTVALIASTVLMFLDGDALQKGTPKQSNPQLQLAEAGLNKVALPNTK
jgi:hypothetical protein